MFWISFSKRLKICNEPMFSFLNFYYLLCFLMLWRRWSLSIKRSVDNQSWKVLLAPKFGKWIFLFIIDLWRSYSPTCWYKGVSINKWHREKGRERRSIVLNPYKTQISYTFQLVSFIFWVKIICYCHVFDLSLWVQAWDL